MEPGVTQVTPAPPSLPLRVVARLGNPLHWDLTDRVLVASGTILFLAVWYLFVEYGLLVPQPQTAPYINRAFLIRIFPFQMALYIGGWLAITLAALLLRRRSPNSRLLVHALGQLFAISFGFAAYCFGSSTSIFTPIIVLVGAVVGYTLFPKLPTTLGVITCQAILIGTTIFEQLGVIPHAPLLLNAPFKDGRLALSWLTTIGGLTYVLMLFGLVLLYFIIDQWHDHEAKLAEASDQLSRANDLISRYVAAQVAEQIRLGNYEAVDRQHRRRLTLFFSDIKGFSEVADHVEPEELSERLNEYFAAMTHIAERYGGTIDKFMGDAIMIFFGAPVATHDRDHAVRAVRMAMEMQGRMTQLRTRWEADGALEPFEIRIGINTGVASVGNFGAPGRMDYTAIGRQVNLAARLQVNCEPGKILLSHSTWVLVRDDIPCVSRGEIQVKGTRDPVKVYEVAAPYPVPELKPIAVAS
jgi:adenylate cyclase